MQDFRVNVDLSQAASEMRRKIHNEIGNDEVVWKWEWKGVSCIIEQ